MSSGVIGCLHVRLIGLDVSSIAQRNAAPGQLLKDGIQSPLHWSFCMLSFKKSTVVSEVRWHPVLFKHGGFTTKPPLHWGLCHWSSQSPIYETHVGLGVRCGACAPSLESHKSRASEMHLWPRKELQATEMHWATGIGCEL